MMVSFDFSFQLTKKTKARKTHYLVSTHQIPGVYNSPFYPPQPSAKEIELRNARPLSHRSRHKPRSQLPPDAAEILNYTQSIKIVSRESRSAPLPPISMTSTAKVQVRITEYLLKNKQCHRHAYEDTALYKNFEMHLLELQT